MYNWRLLLLAFVAVFQPIASFTERNLIDGRQQCCDHRLSRESGNSLYGDNRFKSEDRRVNDQRREIREVRGDDRTVNAFRDSYREREIRGSPELRTRLSREFTLGVRNAIVTPETARNYRSETSTDRIRNAENRRDSQLRVLRTDENRIFGLRDVDDNLDQRHSERRTINSRRETRLMRDNVDEVRRVRDIRDTRQELRRTRNNIIRTERLRALNNERAQDESRNVFARGSNANRRISFGNVRMVKEDTAMSDVRSQERDEIRNIAERRIEIRVRERSGVEEMTSRYLTARPLVLSQRSVRSLDRLSRESNDERRMSYENLRVAKQERENRDVRSDEARNKPAQRNIEVRVRERSDVNSRFSTTQLERSKLGNARLAAHEHKNRDKNPQERHKVRREAERRNIDIRVRERSDVSSSTTRSLARSRRSVRSLDRLSRTRNDDRTLSYENLRIIQQERENRESRDASSRGRDSVRNSAERRMIENRGRERAQVDRGTVSRFTLTRQEDNNNQLRMSMDSSRRNKEFRISFNRERTINDGFRSDHGVHRERNDYDRRTDNSKFVAKSRMDTIRTRAVERLSNQMRNVKDNTHKDHRDLEDQRAREINGRHLSRSESRLFENRHQRSLNARERETSENRRNLDERTVERMQNQRLREVTRDSLRRINTPRELRDNDRTSRGRTFERLSASDRPGSEPRVTREIRQTISVIDSRFRYSENRFRAPSESRLSSSIIERDNVRNIDHRKTDVDERRQATRYIIASKTTERVNIDSRTESNERGPARNHYTSEEKTEDNENRAYENNWQNLMYTIQGIYLCSIFIPMLMKNNDKKKAKLYPDMWTPLQKLIKTD